MRSLVSVIALSFLLGACGQQTSTEQTEPQIGTLADTCPSTVVFQTDWFPQAEHGGSTSSSGTTMSYPKLLEPPRDR